MATVNAYVNFDGTCWEAFQFYKSVFGGDFAYVGKFGDMPEQEGMPEVPESEKNKIMHIVLPISKETLLMGSDTSEAFGHHHIVGNNISLSINAASKEEANKLFDGLVAGGKITMAMNTTFWGAYFGMCTDKFGIHWMINFDEA